MNPARNFGPMVIHAAYDKAWVCMTESEYNNH